MHHHENRTENKLSIGKLIGLGTCPKRRASFSLDLIKSNEKANYCAEFIYSHVKKEWYRMESQYKILLREEAAYHKRLASFFIGKKI